jgi:hypothetical protein
VAVVAVVMAIFPVNAAAGTVAVTCVSEFTLKALAVTPLKVTAVVPVRLTPVMTTDVPTGPFSGAKLLICGVTRKYPLLSSTPQVNDTSTKAN